MSQSSSSWADLEAGGSRSSDLDDESSSEDRRFLWEAWQDLTLIILMVAAVASLALGIKTEGIKEGWYDGGSIAFAVLLVIFVTAVSDYRQSLQFQNLNEEKRNIHLEVIRGGRRVEVSIYDLVVGDVVPLKIRDQVPADGVLIAGHSLKIDESSMTGESKIVLKDSEDPFLMSGCKVADGNGTMLVTSVTEWGKLMASISEDTGKETPLQVRLNKVVTFIGKVGLTVAFLVLIALLVRYFTGHTKDATGNPQFTAGKTKFGDAIDRAIRIVTIAVTIVVVAVPEGLPLAVTLTLASSMRKMMADKALVRRLSACETMGSAATICILTLNQYLYRPGVEDAVRLCQEAGVKVRMVTGDNIQTAKAIATRCGILAPDSDALIEGKFFRERSDEQRDDDAERISVMWGSSPNDKLLLVQALRRRGHVVAVTGGGTNDAPALHEADIGLAMGIEGTEVAKESSDIIILDDNFASVVKIVRWGRYVVANIQKLIQLQLTVLVEAVIINVVAAISSGDVPLNAVQVLWANLIMSTLGALALAMEPPTDHLMDRPPVGRREPLITNIMWRNLLVQDFFQVSALLVLNFRGISVLKLHGPNATTVKNTLIFNTFVLCQIFNAFNARKPAGSNIFRGTTKNLLLMITGTLVLQIIIIEFLGKFTKTKPLTWYLWLISTLIAFTSWPVDIASMQVQTFLNAFT